MMGMKSFVIKELDKSVKYSILNKNISGFTYKSNKAAISKMVIVNPEIIYVLIKSNFDKKYKKILELYLQTMQDNEDGSEGNIVRALDEIVRLRSIFIKKYQTFLQKEEEEYFLKRLKILENELRVKLIDFKLIKEQELVNNKDIAEEKVATR
ncbi:MAG: hypothetical protein K2J20_04665 [Bacilli bacterium]|nr:hypothetical protein [Bacilli bacterium]